MREIERFGKIFEIHFQELPGKRNDTEIPTMTREVHGFREITQLLAVAAKNLAIRLQLRLDGL